MKRKVANDRASKRTASAKNSSTFAALILATILTTTLLGCASGKRTFSDSDGDSGVWRRGRGEYSVVDAGTERDWDAAARRDATTVRGERVVVNKPIDGEIARAQSRPSSDELPELPPPPKRFSERVKGFFSWSKNDDSDVANSDSDAVADVAVESPSERDGRVRDDDASKRSFGESGESAPAPVANRSGAAGAKYGETRQLGANGRSWTSGLSDWAGGLTKSRRVAPALDPIARYDESRFLPDSETFRRYYSPLEPVAPVEPSGFASSGAAFASSGAVPPPTPSAPTSTVRKSGREIVYGDGETNESETTSLARSDAAEKSSNAVKISANRSRLQTARDRYLSGESAFGWNDEAAEFVFAIPTVARPPVRRPIPKTTPEKTPEIANAERTSVRDADSSVAEFFANAPAPSVPASANAPTPTETASIPAAVESPAVDFASQLGEKSFSWFDSATPPTPTFGDEIAAIPETVAVDSEPASDAVASESSPAPSVVANDFPIGNEVELVDDGFAFSTNENFVVALAPENADVASAESPTVLENVPLSVDERKMSSDAKPPTDEEIAWIEQIQRAIRTLLQNRDAKKARGEDVRADDARLRLLYLSVGEYERAIQEIQDENDPLKVFWEKECRGLETLLQNRVEEIDPTLVAERLRSGLDSLSGLCDLRIRKAVLAVAPACFGLFEERTAPYFPGETLYAYSELDFVASAETENGFEIEVECRWRLLDSAGNERTPFEIQRCSNLSETKLRDVVLNVAVPLPSDLESGLYELEMEVVDRNAKNSTPATRRLQVDVEKKTIDGADVSNASSGEKATNDEKIERLERFGDFDAAPKVERGRAKVGENVENQILKR